MCINSIFQKIIKIYTRKSLTLKNVTLFQIPIATLNAVSNLVQSTRPAFQRLRENAQRRIDAANAAAAANQQSQPAPRRQRAHHRRVVATLPADQSTSKVLLNV